MSILRMLRRFSGRRRADRPGFLADERATTAVEMGLIALPLVLLLFGLVEFGRGLHIKTAMNEAADRGQRLLMMDPTASESEVATEIRDAFRAGDDEKLTVEVSPVDVGGETYQRITLVYGMRLLIPNPIGGTLTISSEQLTYTR